MRKIKFRAWFEGHMYEVAKLDFWGDPEQATCDLAGENGEGEELFDIYVGEVEIMQYTGLKDKNGKEIYEGDIILDNEITFDFITADTVGDVRIISRQYTVKYNQAICGLMRFNENLGIFSGHIGLYNHDGLEVIGNIYENPELMV